ncbi:MAG: hypothetical protein K6T16_00100 [Candidatus Pacearchaeota archaeon]|nr:hypothetical protein [Candidatus Pacearchaeota archaeon]
MLNSFLLESNFYLEDNPLYKLVKDLLEKKQVFSATKVEVDTPHCYYAVKYIQLLEEFLNEESIAFVSFPYWIGPQMRMDQYREILYIIGSESDATKETDKLVSIIKECPEGVLCARTRQRLAGTTLEMFEQNLRDIKQENKKMLVINFGPVYFTKEQLKGITELFLPPLLKQKEIY